MKINYTPRLIHEKKPKLLKQFRLFDSITFGRIS